MFLGVIFVAIFLSVLILVHELGHFLAAKKFGLLVEEFGFGLPPRIWGKKIGETVYSVNALPFGGFVKIFGENGIDAERRGLTGVDGEAGADLDGRNFAFKPIWKRAIIISAGVFMNFLLGWLVVSVVFFIGVPQAVFITDVLKNSPAESVGFAAGDKIVGFEKVGEFISYIDANRGEKIVLEIERAGEKISVEVVPRENPPKSEGALGIGLVEAGAPKQGLLTSVWEGLKASLGMVKAIFMAIFSLIGKAFTRQASLDSIAGPVGIVKITAQAGGLGIVYLLQLLAMISLNLAVINFLPFPALDGGRLLFLIAEKIKGSPLPVKFEKFANAAGMALLLFLMLIITIKDIIKLL